MTDPLVHVTQTNMHTGYFKPLFFRLRGDYYSFFLIILSGGVSPNFSVGQGFEL